MVITYHGGEFFKVNFGDTTLAFNPISKDSKIKSSKFGADIALMSLNHLDFNGVEQVTFGEKTPFTIAGPGEYEVGGVFIKGFLAQSEYDKKPLINTIYSVALEGMNICFLGALVGDVAGETLEQLGDIDILFVPIGGEGVLSAGDAKKLVTKLEPKLVIPMHYGEMGEAKALQTFLKEAGAEAVKPTDKLTLKKKDLEGKEADVVVLASQA
jgi:L-ascorbate metabolism protein UlaG (beta-lactamase superfamily)